MEIHPVPEGLDGRDDVQKERFPHPLPPFLDPLGVTRGAEAPGPAGEHDEPFLPAVGTPDPAETAAGIAAVKSSTPRPSGRGVDDLTKMKRTS